MSAPLTAKALVNSVRRRAMVPENTEVYDDIDILEIANEELSLTVLPMLLSLNEEHLVNYEDVPTENHKKSYNIPSRAIGNKLRDVAFVTRGGNKQYELTRISLEELSDYTNDYASNYENFVFYMQNNQVNFPNVSNVVYPFIRMYYYLRPSNITLEKNVGIISSVDKTTGTVTLANFPVDFQTQVLFDLTSKKNPNKLYKFDVPLLSFDRNTNTLVFAVNDIPEDLEPGDLVSKAGETSIPQIPSELHPILAQATAVHILEGLGDTESLNNATARLSRMVDKVSGMINDRVEGAPRKIRQRHSTLTNSTFTNSFRRSRRR